jgi:hypothetical protein
MNSLKYSFLFKKVELGPGAISCGAYCLNNYEACQAGKLKKGSCKAAKDNMCPLVPATPFV